MMLNIGKLQKEIEKSKFTKVEIASKCGIDRKTIENVLSGRDPKLSTVISLASFLGLRISYLFDESMSDNHSATASGHGTTATALDARGNDVILTERVKALEEKIGDLKIIISEKDERIAELKERIDELKARC